MAEGITLRAHIRRVWTDGRDNSKNITLTIFDDQEIPNLLAMHDKSFQVAFVELPGVSESGS